MDVLGREIRQYERTKREEHLEESIRVSRWAVQATSHGHSTHTIQLNNLSRGGCNKGDDRNFTFLGIENQISFYEADLLPRNRPEIYATPRDGRLDLEFEGNRQLIGGDNVLRLIQCLETEFSGV
ncbi:unnamed protein product [Penicillium camemberti]|uniref:Str. FM013 n=1 Tax=Penicillium camemberti (strain FM 013) TaxID=1429867 RepID=A0A0G4P1V3_PENC3|nr:unnamed protein product [Penicillium camemberti]